MVKPVKQSELLESVTRVLGQAEANRTRASEPPPETGDNLPPMRVLLVDDYKHNRFIVQRYLKTHPDG
jgi:PleD family two-component response regulator